MTSKELTELIRQNTRIILPEFGAFLVKDSGDKGFNPANVSFSPFLRYNDGMLEVFVAKKLGISKEEASKVVRDFVEAIKNELLEKGYYEVEGLGELKRYQRGSLSFSLSRPEAQQNTSEMAINKITVIKNKEEVPEPEIEKSDEKSDAWLTKGKPLDESMEDKKPRRITGEKAKIEKLTTSKKSSKPPVANDEPQPEPIIIEPESLLKIDTEQSIEDSISANTITDELEIESNTIQNEITIQIDDKIASGIENKNSPNETEPLKNRFTGLMYTAIAIGIVAILFFLIKSYYFPPNPEMDKDSSSIISEPEKKVSDKIEANDKVEKPIDDIDKAYNEEPNDNKPTQEQIKKERQQEDAIADALIKNSQERKSENKINSAVKFYIIAGSFKNPNYANKFVNELNKSGYTASIVMQPSGMNAVYVGSYYSREEANKAIKEFKNKLTNLWILKK